MQERESALREWLKNTLPTPEYHITPLAGDASFRRYFRIKHNGLSQVIMDAPPDKEDVQPFIYIAKLLAEAQVPTPELIAVDNQQGFLLLGDFGDDLLLNKLNEESANHYYTQAINTLLLMQQCSNSDPTLPLFDKAFMLKEMNLCPEWFLNKYLGLQLTAQEEQCLGSQLNWIADKVAKQALVFIHRDYHSRNLMLINALENPALGVIDFQDAMRGPLCYDLVSLLKDCYISWPREAVLGWVRYFYERNALAQEQSLADFVQAFDLCGLQRHLKVLGVFSRLHLRDGKSAYLKDLPLTLNYVLDCAQRYEALHPLFAFFKDRVTLP